MQMKDNPQGGELLCNHLRISRYIAWTGNPLPLYITMMIVVENFYDLHKYLYTRLNDVVVVHKESRTI